MNPISVITRSIESNEDCLFVDIPARFSEDEAEDISQQGVQTVNEVHCDSDPVPRRRKPEAAASCPADLGLEGRYG